MDMAHGVCIFKNFLRVKICHYYCFLPIHHTAYSARKNIRFGASSDSICFWQSVLTASHNCIIFFFINVSHYFIGYNFVLCKRVFLYLPRAMKLSLADSWFSRMSHIKGPFSPVKPFWLNDSDKHDQRHYFCDLCYVSELC